MCPHIIIGGHAQYGSNARDITREQPESTKKKLLKSVVAPGGCGAWHTTRMVPGEVGSQVTMFVYRGEGTDHSHPGMHVPPEGRALREVLTSILQELQGLTIYAFVMLLLALHKLTFSLMVTMVAEFIFLIHNTLLGEIMISSTRTTRLNEKILYLYSPVGNDIFPHVKIQLH